MNTRLVLLSRPVAGALLCLGACSTGDAGTISAAQLARIDRMSPQKKRPAGPAVIYTVEQIRNANGSTSTDSAEIILRDRKNPQNPVLRVPYNPKNNNLPATPAAGQEWTLYLDNEEGTMQGLFP